MSVSAGPFTFDRGEVREIIAIVHGSPGDCLIEMVDENAMLRDQGGPA